MTASAHSRQRAGDFRIQRGLTWRRLAFVAGVVATLAIGVVSLLLGDLEGGAVTFGFAVSTWLIRVGRGMIGAAGMALVSAVTLYFMLTAAFTNIQAGSPITSVLVSAGLASVALLALLAGFGVMFRREATPTAAPWVAVASSGLMLIALMSGGAAASPAEVEAGGIHLVSENVAFSDTQLTAPAGEVTVTLENNDLFWHTFTIEELGVDLRVPVGAEIPITFDARPGEYRFICDIPGHQQAGMMGILTVEG